MWTQIDPVCFRITELRELRKLTAGKVCCNIPEPIRGLRIKFPALIVDQDVVDTTTTAPGLIVVL